MLKQIYARVEKRGGVYRGLGMAITLDCIVAHLPKVPEHFTDLHWDVARAVAGVLIRDKMIDEAVWLQIVRYATHHVIWSDLVLDLETDADESAKGFGSMKVQRLAYQEKVLAQSERELYLTPSSRHSNLGTAQTSFMDDLIGDAASKAKATTEPEGGVTPFRPRRRVIGG